jgi:hypothetical protein
MLINSQFFNQEDILMNTPIIKLFLSFALLICAQTSAYAVLINDVSAGAANGTNVGLVDILLAEDTQQGSPASELAWVNSVLNPVTTTYNGSKTENVTFYATDTANTYAFSLVSEPGYYVIKNATRIALFENTGELGWGVFDMSLFNYNMNLNDMEISHVTEFGSGNTTQVTEPHTLLLLALGLLGLAASRRVALI